MSASPNNRRVNGGLETQQQHQHALAPFQSEGSHQQQVLHESSLSCAAESSSVGPRLVASSGLNQALEKFDPASGFDVATPKEKLLIHEACLGRLVGEGATLIRQTFADIQRDERTKGWSKAEITNVTACAMRLWFRDSRKETSKSQNGTFFILDRIYANYLKPYAELEGNSIHAPILESIKKRARQEQLHWIVGQYKVTQVNHPLLSGPSDGAYSQHGRLDMSSIPPGQQFDDPNFQPRQPARVWTIQSDIVSTEERRRIGAPATYQQSGCRLQEDTQPAMDNPQRPSSVIPDRSRTSSSERGSVDDDSRHLHENGGTAASTKRRQREGKRPANWRGGNEGESGVSLRKMVQPFKAFCKCLCGCFTSVSGGQRMVHGGKPTQI